MEDEEPEQWHVYLLTCDLDWQGRESYRGARTLYVGISSNVIRRLEQHNAGRTISTAGRTWHLVGTLPAPTKRDAAIMEAWLKVGDSRRKRVDFGIAACSLAAGNPDPAKRLWSKAQIWATTSTLRRAITTCASKIVVALKDEKEHEQK